MNEENTVISSREEHCLQVLPTQVNVRIYAIHTSGPVLAEASANLNGCFTIRGLKVVDVGNGPFISMPDYRTGGRVPGRLLPQREGVPPAVPSGSAGRL